MTRMMLIGTVAVALAAGGSASAAQRGAPARVKAVSAASLAALTPTVPGWEKGEVDADEGEMMGTSYARVDCSYERNDVTVSLQIVDKAGMQMMLGDYSKIGLAAFNEKTGEGYRRSVTIRGHPGLEEWETQTQTATVRVLVAGRFAVVASAYDIPNADAVRPVLDAVDFARLAALK